MKAYITNLGKYNEGALIGEWIELPISEEDLEKVKENIGINDEYEEYFFTDYETEVSLNLSEYEDIETLNELASKLESDVMKAVSELYGKDEILSTDEDDWYLHTDIEDEYDLGYYYVEEAGIYDTASMGWLVNYIDYKSLGRDISYDTEGGFTTYGFIERV